VRYYTKTDIYWQKAGSRLGVRIIQCKALSTPATTPKQHCWMLQVERFFRQSRSKLNMFNLLRFCWKDDILR